MLDARHTDALPCEWDSLRMFGSGDIADEGLVRDWSQAEPSHLWNDGPEPSLRLLLNGKPRVATLQITGLPFIRPGQPLQELTLYINGFRLAFWRLTAAGLNTLSAAIEPEQMLIRGQSLLLSCVFHLPHSIRPMDLGEGSDRRALGFCFETLLISEG
jgi:hypothetical protein